MEQIFNSEIRGGAFKEKRRLLIIWSIIAGTLFLLSLSCVIINIWRVQSYLDRSLRPLCTFGAILYLSAAGCYSLFFFRLKFAQVYRFCKMLKDADSGLKDSGREEFVRFDDSITSKDGLEFYKMVCVSRPLGRSDITERVILIEKSVPKPSFLEGDIIKTVSHAGILLEYEVIGTDARRAQEDL